MTYPDRPCCLIIGLGGTFSPNKMSGHICPQSTFWCHSKSRVSYLKKWIGATHKISDIPKNMERIDIALTTSIGKHLSPVRIEIWRPQNPMSHNRLQLYRHERYASQNLTDQGHPTTWFALPELPGRTRGNICGLDHPVLFPLPSPARDPRVAPVNLARLCSFWL
jgi:hypothetical protein